MFFTRTAPSRHVLFLALSAVHFSFYSTSSHAGIVINGTRVIYEQKEKSITVQLTNEGTEPVLAQSWIDDGDEQAPPQHIRVPFVLTPPINRVEPKKGQALRISYTGKALPQNKESVFWLNMLEIPSKAEGAGENLLQMAFRSRIKMFFRPSGLQGTASEAAASLRWSMEGSKVMVSNASAFHVSLVTVAIKGDNRKPTNGEMLTPGSVKQLTIAGAAAGKILAFEWVNDYGAIIVTESTIQSSSTL
ncbi:pilus assembly protein PapD [Enterobacterales bacterium CwR94]|nr:pilus assembly protein PapD [Enterobacterales bacterium CwR94]